MKKIIIISVLVGATIGILIAAFLFVRFWPRPGPAQVTEVAQPAPDTVQERKQGHLSGSVAWSTPTAQNILPPKTADDSTTQDTQPATPGSALGEYRIPVSGELTTQYYYAGQKIGEGTHQITGETTVTLAPEGITADTRFEDISNLRIDLPEYHGRIYAGVKTDLSQVIPMIGVGYQWDVGCFYLDVSGKVWKAKEWGGQLETVIGYRF